MIRGDEAISNRLALTLEQFRAGRGRHLEHIQGDRYEGVVADKPGEIDDAPLAAETIGYEILTSLGGRFHRVYRGGSR